MDLTILNAEGKAIELTRQEFKILKLASEGMTNKEIGDVYCIAESTVKCHRQNIMKKVEISGKGEMMRFLMKVNVEISTKGL
jgi:DNA-binding NarL/FixJ family response regulator